jgi:ABC-type siderophore export system fused ATPase/permease subunit
LSINGGLEIQRIICIQPVQSHRPGELTNNEPARKKYLDLAAVSVQFRKGELMVIINGDGSGGSKTYKLYALMRKPFN